MGIDDLVGNEGKISPQYSYFKVISGNTSKAFGDMDSAIQYAVESNNYKNILKEVIIYKTLDGSLRKGEKFLYIIPNNIIGNEYYHMVGEDVGDEEPDFICFYNGMPKGYVSLEEYLKETDKSFDDRSDVGLYRVIVTVNDDDKTISVKYKLISKIKKSKTR